MGSKQTINKKSHSAAAPATIKKYRKYIPSTKAKAVAESGDITHLDTRDELDWQAKFASSKDALENLFDEIADEYKSGKTTSVG